jgi:hypothetical protein
MRNSTDYKTTEHNEHVGIIYQLRRIHLKYDGNWIYTLAMCE